MPSNLLQFKPRVVETPYILICAKCGEENEGTANFCSHCGKALRPQLRSTKQQYAPLTKHTKVPLKTMAEITAMLKELVGTYQVIKGTEYLFAPPHEVVGRCPRCGGQIAEMHRAENWQGQGTEDKRRGGGDGRPVHG